MTDHQLPEPTVRPIRYEVSLLPEADINYRFYVLHVVCITGDEWAVWHLNTSSLGIDGQWSDGIKSYGREGWNERHRFDLEIALRLAKAAAPHVIVNGVSASDVLAKLAESGD